MSDPKPSRQGEPVSGSHALGSLLSDVQRTRDALRGLLNSTRPGSTAQVTEAREEARTALEEFVAVLMVRRLPVPRQINDELQLMRRLCGRPWRPARSEPDPLDGLRPHRS